MFEKIDDKLIREFEDHIKQDWSPQTAVCYSTTIRAYCLGMRAKNLNDRKTLREIKAQVAAKWKPNTTARHLRAIKSFLFFMEETRGWKLVDLSFMRYKQERNKKVAYLSPAQISMVRAVPIVGNTSLRHRALFELLLYTGCRISEALSIKKQDVDWETGDVEVCGKGGKYRVVNLGDSIEWVQKSLATRNDNYDILFVTQKGQPWHRVPAGDAMRKLGEKAGLAFNLHPHIIRKTCLSYMLWSGVDIKEVQIYAGHSNIETTYSHYIGLRAGEQQRAHAYLCDALKTEHIALVEN